jgi:hypothetical protein
MAEKFTMSLPDEEFKLVSEEAAKVGISIQQYLRAFAIQAARASKTVPAKTTPDDLFEAIEKVLIHTQGIANLVQVAAGESAVAAAGVKRLLKVEHPGRIEAVKRQGMKVRSLLQEHWSRVLDLAR